MRPTRVAALLAAAVLALVSAPASAAPPRIDARAAIVVQPDTGDVVARRNATSERPIASATKLMTALITLEQADLDDTFTAVDYHASPVESLVGLQVGERMTVRDLMRGLLLASGNDAAATLAARVSGSRKAFVAEMNARARELGLRHTRFANPIGLDDRDNYSSAEDLAKLALVLLRNPFFSRTVDLPAVTLRSGSRPRRIVNRNTLVRQVPWVDGVKTGHTNLAGYVLVTAASRHGVRLVSVVIGDPTERARNADTLSLLRYGLARYNRSEALRKGRVLARPMLAYRGDERTELVAAKAVDVVLRRDERASVRVIGAPTELDGPLKAGARVGTIVVSRRGTPVARVALVTSEAVAAPSLGDRVSSSLSGIWPFLLIGAAAICSLHLALRRRRRIRRRQARARRRRGTEAA